MSDSIGELLIHQGQVISLGRASLLSPKQLLAAEGRAGGITTRRLLPNTAGSRYCRQSTSKER
jgi:hypothetical protein